MWRKILSFMFSTGVKFRQNKVKIGKSGRFVFSISRALKMDKICGNFFKVNLVTDKNGTFFKRWGNFYRN